eukprot:TRINITY_DN10867_c0_g1_i1.p1 TRINITY_DN10867_c0_g1~~TRINITY_DN10867_c0_g1_i1.p1  ORF type:complete len:106 (-),score=20.59 TRINITY_DN10867_c0_g1_i1:119-436(-)
MIRIAMLIEYPVVLGFCVAMLVPFSALALAHGTAVLPPQASHNSQASSCRKRPRPSSAYMALSWGLGCVMDAWLFLACGLHGKYLVVVGMPVSAWVVGWMVRKKY